MIVLDQATDPLTFFPEPVRTRPSPRARLRRQLPQRPTADAARLLPTDHDLAVYGADWDGLIDMKHVVAERVPNDELRRIYSSASIVLADHWDDMREHGFISNRIYDALACGACVISDDVAGLDERFGGAVATYRTPKELQALVARLLADPGAGRDGRARAGGDRRAGNFRARVDVLLAAIDGAGAALAA